jgi:hypothetical protein
MGGDGGIDHYGATPDRTELQRVSPRKPAIRVADASRIFHGWTGAPQSGTIYIYNFGGN